MSDTTKKVFFAKIIELPKHQVLVSKVKTDNPEAPFALRVESDVYGKRVGLNMGFPEMEHVDDAFAAFNMKGAEEIVENMILQLEEVANSNT